MRRRSVLVLAGALVASIWLAVEVAGPAAIRAAHAGRGPEMLQSALAGRAAHPASHYVAVWRARARPAAAALTALIAAAAALSGPAARRRLARALAPADDSAAAPPPRGRRIAVAGLAAVFTAGSLVELALDPSPRVEHWPFSPYGMYSEIPRATRLTGRRLFGVTADAAAREVPLDGEYIRPFDRSRLWFSWNRFDQNPDRARLLTESMGDCLRRYEARRAAGRHSGPPLSAVRLYQLTWDVDARASNRDAPRRELIWEVRASTPPIPSS
jgi:hypothetical protein